MNLYDAASIVHPFRERDLDPPVTTWTDADERDFAVWFNLNAPDLQYDFAIAERDRFDEFCRDKFDDEQRARADAAMDAGKEGDAP